jgi:hypothetical protein
MKKGEGLFLAINFKTINEEDRLTSLRGLKVP